MAAVTLTPQFLQFFEQLAQNNHADWFTAHKPEYEATVKKPFEALVGALLAELVKDEPALSTLQPKHCIYRIYRDVRFSKDKTPYKTHASGHIALGSKSDADVPGFYFQIGADGCYVASGCYAPTNTALYKIRQEIVYQTEQWEAILQEPTFARLWGDIKGEALKTAPRDFRDEVEQLPILKHKQFYVWTDLDRKLMTSPQLVSTLADYYRAARPLNQFLTRAVQDGL